jgi:hypothetical protein
MTVRARIKLFRRACAKLPARRVLVRAWLPRKVGPNRLGSIRCCEVVLCESCTSHKTKVP